MTHSRRDAGERLAGVVQSVPHQVVPGAPLRRLHSHPPLGPQRQRFHERLIG